MSEQLNNIKQAQPSRESASSVLEHAIKFHRRKLMGLEIIYDAINFDSLDEYGEEAVWSLLTSMNLKY